MEEEKTNNDNKEKKNESNSIQPVALKAALARVRQVLALIDMPLAQEQPLPPRPTLQAGLLYGLQDLLTHLNGVLHIPNSGAQGIAAAIGAETGGPTPAEGLAPFVQIATNMIHMSNQVSSLLKEHVQTSPNDMGAIGILEKALEASPLTKASEDDIILRMRKKRRLVDQTRAPCKVHEVTESFVKSTSRSPIYPLPKTLNFIATTSWLDDVLTNMKGHPLPESLTMLVEAFNEDMKKKCENESLILVNHQGHVILPAHRVRARVAFCQPHGGEIHVEIRGVGLVILKLEDKNQKLQIINLGICAPSEYPNLRNRSSSSLLPSSYAYYNEISSHLLVYALKYHEECSDDFKAIAQSLMHISALRTLYDPLPTPATFVQPMISRVTFTELDWDRTLDRTQSIVWKWCRVLKQDQSDQGEWCAYFPSMM